MDWAGSDEIAVNTATADFSSSICSHYKLIWVNRLSGVCLRRYPTIPDGQNYTQHGQIKRINILSFTQPHPHDTLSFRVEVGRRKSDRKKDGRKRGRREPVHRSSAN